MKKILLGLVSVIILGSCTMMEQPDPDENIDVSEIGGKYTYLGFVGTYCPYCQEDMPVLDSFYKKYKNQVDMQLFVLDSKYFRGDYKIPQDINPQVTFQDLTGEQCGYVPSYIILDPENNLVDSACGGKLSFEQLETIMNVSSETEQINQEKERLEGLKNREVSKGDTVSMHYIGTIVETGEEFDNSYDRGASLDFEIGAGMMIPGFEREIMGMKVGEKRTFELDANDAYGEYSEEYIEAVPRSELKEFEDAGFEFVVGNKLPTMYGEFEIMGVDEESVTIDLNHFLAGKDLKFEVELLDFNN